MIRFLGLMIVVVMMAGCASLSGDALSQLKVGMPKQDAVDKVGKPDFVTAAKTEQALTQELWEYRVNKNEYNESRVWLVFNDQKLVAWGNADDFTNYNPKRVLANDFLKLTVPELEVNSAPEVIEPVKK